jgi:hypothetical protein
MVSKYSGSRGVFVCRDLNLLRNQIDNVMDAFVPCTALLKMLCREIQVPVTDDEAVDVFRAWTRHPVAVGLSKPVFYTRGKTTTKCPRRRTSFTPLTPIVSFSRHDFANRE